MLIFLEFAEKAFIVLGLSFFSGAFGVGSSVDTPGLETPSIIPRIIISLIRYSVWSISILLICLNWKKALATAKNDIFIWILTPIILSSYFWSEFPDYTLKNMQEVWQMTIFGLYFATRFCLKDQIKLVATTLGIGAFFSTYFALISPSVGQDVTVHIGSWKGLYDYKNTLGSMMSLSYLTFLLLPVNKPNHRLYKWAGFALSVFLILRSNSKTALVLSFIIILILLFYRNYRWRGKISLIYLDIGILILACVGTVVLTQWVAILSGLGKDPTLTGRLPLWGFLIARITDRPWLGYGRGAIWAPESKYSRQAGSFVTENYLPPHAHNGYIDLGLDAGLIVLSLFIVSFAITYLRALQRAYAAKKSEDLWPLAVLLFLAINNFSESYLLRGANIYWVLYITVALTIKQKNRNSFEQSKFR
ncbi:O-antigen ligase family protein [Plectonema radiosum NIES-515]|uniref:O-antigen ligase family protein n=1 Tax=Plectonema radiosum NIES-515 TaxID=2986073 RepID=A0ABT3B132_9CYAN|nr:O-antigen ligase family protein [Plectonema radiosum]MCV3214945.1 O-antigen ligase family protein [Plectonema radiosum NIES-515]